ncbi:MAG: thioredoxin family protein [Cyanobacteria bacterium J06635_15]
MAIDVSDSAKQSQDSASEIQAPGSPSPPLSTQVRNLIIVVVAAVLTVAVVLGVQTQTPSASLGELAEEAVPLEQALINQQPTLVEFYANWCTSCQAMAGDMAQLRSRYGEQVNFVMLNVDNSKWLPEMLHYRVDGIPHFVYLDGTGETMGTVIGEQPKAVIAANLDALLAQASLPYAQAVGRTSGVDSPLEADRDRPDDPRSHGAQVVN